MTELRAWLLSGSQYHGFEYVELFLGIVVLWVVFRLGLFDEGRALLTGPRMRSLDAVLGVLTVVVLVSVGLRVG